MARRLQELFGDLADEDFLSAVQDAENRFAPPGSSSEPGGGSQAAAPPTPPSWDVAPQDEPAADRLLLAACAELEGAEGPGGAQGARKKPRLGDETPPPQPGGLQGGRPPLPPPTAGPGPRLALRPTAAGSGPPRTPAPVGPPPQNMEQQAPHSSGARPPLAQPPRATTAPREGSVGKEPPPRELPPPKEPPGGLPTPLVTNHLVQLVAAASRAPPAPPRLPPRGKTRRFPGPAGILPQQHAGKLLEQVLVAAPTAPAHGAVAKVRTEELPSSPQPPEEDFGKGPWLTMKAELGLDERDPSCFLRTYSVVMVLRKAALRQLPKNKVPSMAVMIKSLTRTNVDAGAVFRDPTGEMQGTVHRLLLEERQGQLKPGAVLLLKQVGVFSPSHRNHYLNVTPTNLLRIYPPEPEGSLSQPEVPAPAGSLQEHPAPIPRDVPAPADWGPPGTGSHGPQQPPGGLWLQPRSHEPGHGELGGADGYDMDDLDGLLGELPEDFFSAPAQADCCGSPLLAGARGPGRGPIYNPDPSAGGSSRPPGLPQPHGPGNLRLLLLGPALAAAAAGAAGAGGAPARPGPGIRHAAPAARRHPAPPRAPPAAPVLPGPHRPQRPLHRGPGARQEHLQGRGHRQHGAGDGQRGAGVVARAGAVGAEPPQEADVGAAHRGRPGLRGLRPAPAAAGGGGGRGGGGPGPPARRRGRPPPRLRPPPARLRRRPQPAERRGHGPAAPLHRARQPAVRGAAAGPRGAGEPGDARAAADGAARGGVPGAGGARGAVPAARRRPGQAQPPGRDPPERRLRRRRAAPRGPRLPPGGREAAGRRRRPAGRRPQGPHAAAQRLRQRAARAGPAAAAARRRRHRPQRRRRHPHGLRPARRPRVPAAAPRAHHRAAAAARRRPRAPQDAAVLLRAPPGAGAGAQRLRARAARRRLGGRRAAGAVGGAPGLLRLGRAGGGAAAAPAAPGSLRPAPAPGRPLPRGAAPARAAAPPAPLPAAAPRGGHLLRGGGGWVGYMGGGGVPPSGVSPWNKGVVEVDAGGWFPWGHGWGH